MFKISIFPESTLLSLSTYKENGLCGIQVEKTKPVQTFGVQISCLLLSVQNPSVLEEPGKLCFKNASIRILKHVVNILAGEDINHGKDTVKRERPCSFTYSNVILKFEMQLFQTREDMIVFSKSLSIIL